LYPHPHPLSQIWERGEMVLERRYKITDLDLGVLGVFSSLLFSSRRCANETLRVHEVSRREGGFL
jgi:hypothetical protein